MFNFDKYCEAIKQARRALREIKKCSDNMGCSHGQWNIAHDALSTIEALVPAAKPNKEEA